MNYLFFVHLQDPSEDYTPFFKVVFLVDIGSLSQSDLRQICRKRIIFLFLSFSFHLFLGLKRGYLARERWYLRAIPLTTFLI